MSRIVLQILDSQTCRWTRRQEDGRWSDPVSGALAEAVRQIGSEPVDVLVPSDQVLLTEVAVAARQQRRLLQALPFAVEEQLAGDVGDYHVALGIQLADHRYLVAAVDRQTMDGWTQALHDAGIETRSMVPNVLAVPLEDGAATLVIDDRTALLRVSQTRGYSVGVGEIDAYLELETDIERLLVVDPAGVWTASGTRPVKTVPLRGSLLQLFAASTPERPLVDLMQGRYQTRGQVANKALRLWRWVAIVVGVALLTEVGHRGLDLQAQTRQLNDLRSESQSLVTQAFPDIERVVDARAQMQQRLEALRGASGSGGGGFIFLVRAAGPTLAREKDLEIRGASYRSGALVIDVHAPDLATIERVRQQLQGTLDVELESAATLADGADARLRLNGRAG